jgi:hypothetical protein
LEDSSLSGDKVLPIHLVVEALEKNIVELPLGQPEFADRRYRSIPLDPEFFTQIPATSAERLVAFVDGGNMEIASAPNFAIALTRLYFSLFKGDKRIESHYLPQRVDFYTVCFAVLKSGQIVYRTEFIPLKEEWREYLPSIQDLELNSFDRTIMLGMQRASINRVLDVARAFAEWRFSSYVIKEELQKGDVLVRDGSLQTSVTNESKYANEAYEFALEKGIYFSGISKTSTLFTDTGQPLFSAIHELSEATPLKDDSWYYHPIVEIDHPDHRAAMFAVKLNKQSEYVFRFEILRDQVTKQTFKEVESVISALAANSVDIGFPGYPYGLIDADRLGRVSMNEKTAHAFQFKAAASRKGVWEKISKFIKSSDAHEILNKLIG